MANLYFEDFAVGQTFETASYTVSEDEAVAFGRRYVPMPYHTDPVQAKAYPYGGLIVPGHLSAAIAFGLFAKTGVLDASGIGAAGANIRWLVPVRPGDTLRVVATIAEVSPAAKPGGRDAIRIRLDCFNQDGALVLTHETLQFVRRRPVV
jgi:acyl dehydratase